MRRNRVFGAIASASLVMAMTVACSDRDADKAAAEAKSAGDRAAGTAKSAASDASAAAKSAAGEVKDAVANGGRAADAAVETMDVKAALSADSRVDASDINVDTDHVTKTVTLRGKVPTAEQKALAEQVATQRATGYTVRNLLAVGR